MIIPNACRTDVLTLYVRTSVLTSVLTPGRAGPGRAGERYQALMPRAMSAAGARSRTVDRQAQRRDALWDRGYDE